MDSSGLLLFILFSRVPFIISIILRIFSLRLIDYYTEINRLQKLQLY